MGLPITSVAKISAFLLSVGLAQPQLAQAGELLYQSQEGEAPATVTYNSGSDSFSVKVGERTEVIPASEQAKLVALLSSYPSEALRRRVYRRLLTDVPPPSPRQILAAALGSKREAELPTSAPEACPVPPEPEKVPFFASRPAGEPAMVLCEVWPSAQAARQSQAPEAPREDRRLVVGELVKEAPRKKLKGSSVTFTTANDNDYANNKLHKGNDLDGHTYGSKLQGSFEFERWRLNLSGGSDLYVKPAQALTRGQPDPETGFSFYSLTNVRKVGGRSSYYQLADEHSFLNLGVDLKLTPDPELTDNRRTGSRALSFTLGVERDSDRNHGFLGAIGQRKWFHEDVVGTYGLTNLPHMKDRWQGTAQIDLSQNHYVPVGALGLCAEVKLGVKGTTKGMVSGEGRFQASIDSGRLFGFDRADPLVRFIATGTVHEPLLKGQQMRADEPDWSSITDGQLPDYFYLPSGTPGAVSDRRDTRGILTVDIGGRKYRLSLSAIWERNAYSDGDIVWSAAIKRAFK